MSLFSGEALSAYENLDFVKLQDSVVKYVVSIWFNMSLVVVLRIKVYNGKYIENGGVHRKFWLEALINRSPSDVTPTFTKKRTARDKDILGKGVGILRGRAQNPFFPF